MKKPSQPRILSIVAFGSLVLLLACNDPSAAEIETASGPADVEAAYFNLSMEVQNEVLGTQFKPLSEMRKELLAKADADGDGKLSEAEKAALRAELKTLKDEMKAELKAKVDTDADGEVSAEEKKAGLEGMGQKIKAVIKAKHEELRTAQQAARARIKEACGDVRGEGSAEGDIESTLDECKAVIAEEKEKLRTMLKESIESIKAEIEELKGMLAKVESESTTI